jgi:hypothetical protein
MLFPTGDLSTSFITREAHNTPNQVKLNSRPIHLMRFDLNSKLIEK